MIFLAAVLFQLCTMCLAAVLFLSLLNGMLGRRNEPSDLTEIAELFVSNDVTGKRLLLLTLDSLHEMGIQSIGCAVEIYVSNH